MNGYGNYMFLGLTLCLNGDFGKLRNPHFNTLPSFDSEGPYKTPKSKSFSLTLSWMPGSLPILAGALRQEEISASLNLGFSLDSSASDLG